jgi:hypothetical protein
MIYEIKNLTSEKCISILKFYARYGDRSFSWYEKKLKDDILSGTVIGKYCINNNNEIIAAYLGKIQSLISNPSLKVVQSIDTLVAPSHRGGHVLIKLAKEFYDYLKIKSFDCVFGLPNKKIEKFRYKFLKWNLSRPTYSYTVFFPIFFLRLFYYCIKHFINKKNFFKFSQDKIYSLKKNLKINKFCKENENNEAYWISSENFYFTFIGLCRAGRKLNILDKFIFLSNIASSSKGFFLKTYSTEDTETASIFKTFSFKKKALNFSGIVLANNSKLSFGEQSLEFIEFDTFGLL